MNPYHHLTNDILLWLIENPEADRNKVLGFLRETQRVTRPQKGIMELIDQVLSNFNSRKKVKKETQEKYQ